MLNKLTPLTLIGICFPDTAYMPYCQRLTLYRSNHHYSLQVQNATYLHIRHLREILHYYQYPSIAGNENLFLCPFLLPRILRPGNSIWPNNMFRRENKSLRSLEGREDFTACTPATESWIGIHVPLDQKMFRSHHQHSQQNFEIQHHSNHYRNILCHLHCFWTV